MEIKYSHHGYNCPCEACCLKSKGKTHAELKESNQFSERDTAESGLNRRERIDDGSNSPYFYPFN